MLHKLSGSNDSYAPRTRHAVTERGVIAAYYYVRWIARFAPARTAATRGPGWRNLFA